MNLSRNGEQVEETRKLVRGQMKLRLLDAAQVVVTLMGRHMKELRLGHLQHQYGAGRRMPLLHKVNHHFGFLLLLGKGSYGKKCVVMANQFFLSELPLKNPPSVTITPEETSRGVNCVVMEQLLRLYHDSYLGKRLPYYDGHKCLYTTCPSPPN
ncbi:hypothetical protein MTR_3g076870 [Medicago truncatula]|uniref:Uncharacterized protein n=1 Tax=Medicago truncatula TaxID=3880 RepID=G7J4A5_MEDTR|nr:hypothetical protein MTR_3g076870 [Medicago truncatula]